ncbi:hypothetical protein B0H19DRAFT_1056861 [Mycena capillaripes]|nr:hypothetical protein B0H19DRAFT_1056861 [Mycena capillaripes]
MPSMIGELLSLSGTPMTRRRLPYLMFVVNSKWALRLRCGAGAGCVFGGGSGELHKNQLGTTNITEAAVESASCADGIALVRGQHLRHIHTAEGRLSLLLACLDPKSRRREGPYSNLGIGLPVLLKNVRPMTVIEANEMRRSGSSSRGSVPYSAHREHSQVSAYLSLLQMDTAMCFASPRYLIDRSFMLLRPLHHLHSYLLPVHASAPPRSLLSRLHHRGSLIDVGPHAMLTWRRHLLKKTSAR